MARQPISAEKRKRWPRVAPPVRAAIGHQSESHRRKWPWHITTRRWSAPSLPYHPPPPLSILSASNHCTFDTMCRFGCGSTAARHFSWTTTLPKKTWSVDLLVLVGPPPQFYGLRTLSNFTNPSHSAVVARCIAEVHRILRCTPRSPHIMHRFQSNQKFCG